MPGNGINIDLAALEERRKARAAMAAQPGVLGKAAGAKNAPSVVGQFKNLVAGLPSGLVHLGQDVIKSAPSALLNQVSGGGLGQLNPGNRVVAQKAQQATDRLSSVPVLRSFTPNHSWREGELEKATEGLSPYQARLVEASRANPLSAGFAQSVTRTAQDVIHPTNFAKASRDGTIVGKLIEDLGNLSIVGGAGAKALGRAGETAAAAGNAERAATLANAAAKVERVAKLGGETANAPMSVWRGGLRAAGRGAGDVVERLLGRGDGRVLEEHNVLTDSGRKVNRFGRYGETVDEKGNVTALEGVGRGEENRAGGNVGRLREHADKVLPNVADQAVLEAQRRAVPETIGRGVAEFLPALEADPVLAQRYMSMLGLPEEYGLPELRKIVEAGTGQLDPALAQRMAHAREILAPINQERTAGFQDPRTFQGHFPGQQFVDESINSFEPLSLAKDRINLERAAIEERRAAAEKKLRPVAARAGALERELASREAFAGQSKPLSVHEGYRSGVQVGRAQERLTAAQRAETAAGRKLNQAADEYFAKVGRETDASPITRAEEGVRTAEGRASAEAAFRQLKPRDNPLEQQAFEELAGKVAKDPALYDELGQQYMDALEFEDRVAQIEKPSKEAIKAYREQQIAKATEDTRSLQGELVRLGGTVDDAGNVTFPIKPQRGTAEWDWWEQLSGKERSKIGAKYLRGGPRPLGIDELASSLGMGVEEWASKFRDTVKAFEEARGLKRESGRIAQKDLAGRMFKEQAGELEQYRPKFSPADIEAIIARADEIANGPMDKATLTGADQRAVGAAFERVREAKRNLNRAVEAYTRADKANVREATAAADGLARAQEAMNRASEGVRTMRTRSEATEAFLKPQNPMTQAQRDAEMRQLGTVRTKARLAGSQRDRLASQVERANKDIAELPRKFDEKLRADPMSYPKRLRPAMAVAQNARKGALDIAKEFEASGNQELANLFKQGADQILDRPEEWAQLGINPEHTIGGSSDLRVDDRLNTRGRRKEGPLVQSKSGSYEHKSDAPTKWVADFRSAAYKEAEAASAQVRNRTSTEMAQRFGTTAAKEGITGPPETVWAEMRARGLEAWNPDAREGGMLTLPRDKVTPETVWLPKGTIREFQTYWDQGPGLVMGSIEAVNRIWKPAVLVANPKWQITNVVSGFVSATFAAKESPLTIMRTFREAWKMQKEHPERLPEFSRSTMTSDERQYLSQRPEKEPRTAVGRGYQRFSKASYGLNTFFDNTYKSAVYLAKTEKGMAPFEAIRVANKAIGDFDRLSPFEQKYVKTVLPFYAWMKHITRLTSELAIDDPVRVVWALNVAQHFGDDQKDLPSFLKGSVKVGDKFLPLGQLNPFQDAAGGRNIFTSPTALLGATSPAIKQLVAATTGANLSRPGLEMKRPDDTKAGPLNPLTRPMEFVNYAANQVPLARFVRDVNPLGPGPVARYDQGGKYVVNGQYMRDENRGGAVANLVVPGVPKSFNVEEYQAKQAKAKAREQATLKAAAKRRRLKR